MCCRFTTYSQSVFVLMYFLLLASFISHWITVYPHYNHFSPKFVLMGVVMGVGFLPLCEKAVQTGKYDNTVGLLETTRNIVLVRKA